jgi:hypothetical protein
MKFWGESMGSNLLTYALLMVTTVASLGDPTIRNNSPSDGNGAPQEVATQPDDRQVQ